MKKVKIAVGVIAIIIISFIYAHISKANMIYDKNVDNSEYLSTGVVYEGEIQQSFLCNEDFLDAIQVRTQVFGDVSEMQVEYRLLDGETEQVLASGTVNSDEIESSRFYEFNFDRIENTNGKEYIFELKNIGAKENQGIGFYFQPAIEDNTFLVISDNKTEGTLIMKTVTNRFDVETFVIFLIFLIYIIVFMNFLYKLFNK